MDEGLVCDSAMKTTGAPRQDPPPHRRTPDDEPPLVALQRAFGRFWRTERPGLALTRDIAVVVVVLGVILGGLWTYSGQGVGQPPIVVVESGSMMHPEAPYGRIGTIDPGDLVVVKRVDPTQIETAYARAGTSYGGYGDVIVFRPLGDTERTPIIHRAITWVEVTPGGSGDDHRYTYLNQDGQMVSMAQSVDLPQIGIVDMRPPASGFVTKGDNPRTNHAADQVTHFPDRLVEPDWLVGVAKGQAPWMGLIKLALTGTPAAPLDGAGFCQVLRAQAPCDTWVMLGASVGVVLLVPVTLELLWKRTDWLKRWIS
jgi:signal peptidase I